MRTVYYTNNFLVDFPRTLKVLSDPNITSIDQAEIFKTFLNQQQHSTLVVTVTWERFIEVMGYLHKAKVDGLEGIDGLSWAELEMRVENAT